MKYSMQGKSSLKENGIRSKKKETRFAILFRTYVNEVCELFFPARCPFCDEILEDAKKALCEKCRTKIRYVGQRFCLHCGKLLWDEKKEYCADCRKRKHAYDRGRILLVYEDAVKEAIYRFKYGKRKAYAVNFAKMLCAETDSFLRDIRPDGIVPVPLYFLRYHKRGYNQSYLLAKEIGRRYSIPVYNNLVIRAKNTKAQKTLSLVQRQNNLNKAFKMKQNDVKLDTILLVDDIYTTGSTLDAVAGLLKEAGVSYVYFVALAGGVDRRE